jgi:hypothetical protein
LFPENYRKLPRSAIRIAEERRSPALPVIICDIFDAAWLLEIEAVAAA